MKDIKLRNQSFSPYNEGLFLNYQLPSSELVCHKLYSANYINLYQDEMSDSPLQTMNDVWFPTCKIITEIHSIPCMIKQRITPCHELHTMNDGKRFTSCHEFWYRDSLHTINDGAEIHSTPWVITYRLFTLRQERQQRYHRTSQMIA